MAIIKWKTVAVATTDVATVAIAPSILVVGHLMANQCSAEVYFSAENDCVRDAHGLR